MIKRKIQENCKRWTLQWIEKWLGESSSRYRMIY